MRTCQRSGCRHGLIGEGCSLHFPDISELGKSLLRMECRTEGGAIAHNKWNACNTKY